MHVITSPRSPSRRSPTVSWHPRTTPSRPRTKLEASFTSRRSNRWSGSSRRRWRTATPTTAPTTNYPVLTKTNYNVWAFLMKIKLEAKCLWGAIEPGGVAIERHEDRMALDAICSVVPSEMISTLVVKEFAKEAWESIHVMRIGDDRIRKTSVQRLRCECEELALWDGEDDEDFALRQWHRQSISTLGNPEAPKKVVEKYLRIAPVKYKQLVISMETLLDISRLSIEEVTSRLLASEDNPEPTPSQVGGKLYLTEEQWVEQFKQKEAENGRTNNSSGGRGKRRGSKGKGHGGGNTDTCKGSKSTQARNGDFCCY